MEEAVCCGPRFCVRSVFRNGDGANFCGAESASGKGTDFCGAQSAL